MPSSLTLRVLGDKDEGVLEQFEFYSGEIKTLTLQLYDSKNLQKVAIPATATKTLRLAATPDDLSIANADITVDTNDASIFSVEITSSMSALMISGSIQFTYTVAAPASTRIAVLEFGQSRLDTMAD